MAGLARGGGCVPEVLTRTHGSQARASRHRGGSHNRQHRGAGHAPTVHTEQRSCKSLCSGPRAASLGQLGLSPWVLCQGGCPRAVWCLEEAVGHSRVVWGSPSRPASAKGRAPGFCRPLQAWLRSEVAFGLAGTTGFHSPSMGLGKGQGG